MSLSTLLFGTSPAERRIGITAALVLVIIALLTTLAAYTFFGTHIEAEQKQGLERTLSDRSRLLLQDIERFEDDVAVDLHDRLRLRHLLLALDNGTANQAERHELAPVLDSLVQAHHYSAFQLHDSRGGLLASRGHFARNPQVNAQLATAYRSTLLWDKQLLLRVEVEFKDTHGRRFGSAVIERPLRASSEMLSDNSWLGTSGETLLCAAEDAQHVKCFPSRMQPQTTVIPRFINGRSLAINHALENKSGVTSTLDYRAQQAVIAYQPLLNASLAMEVKVDNSDLHQLLLLQLYWLLPVLALLVLLGFVLLRWRVGPLVHQLADTQAQLQGFLDHSPSVLFLKDLDGRYQLVNRKFLLSFGLAEHQTLGKTDADLFSTQQATKFRNHDLDVIKHGKTLEFEETADYLDGTHISIVYKFPVFNAAGKIMSVGGIATDITARKQAEQALLRNHDELTLAYRKLEVAQANLLQSEKMASIGQLAAGVAHEINNPLAFVHSNLDSLENYQHDLLLALEAYQQAVSGCTANAEMAASLKQLKQELDLDFLKQDIPVLMQESRTGLQRIKDIVQSLRDFAEINASNDWHWENVHHCLDSTLNVLQGALPAEISIIREYGDLPEINCLPAKLSHACMNILLNAAQAITGPGAITLRTAQVDNMAKIEIIDSGQGISPENMGHIFEPFFTTKPVGTGTGLGLSATYNIIEQHHGRIEVESTPGKGSLFRVWLPIYQDSQASAENIRPAFPA